MYTRKERYAMITSHEFSFEYGGSSITAKAFITYPNTTQSSDRLTGGRLRVDITAATNFPYGVFVWEMYVSTFASRTGEIRTRPVCVAKPADLESYQEGQPAELPKYGDLPFYRESYIDFLISSPDILLDTWDSIQTDLAALVRTTVDLGGVQA